MLIYLAGRFSRGDVGENINNVIKIADKLVKMGYIPVIPHLLFFWDLISPKPHQFWLDYDLHFIEVCDAILRLPGESLGADSEVRYGERLGKKIYYSIEELE